MLMYIMHNTLDIYIYIYILCIRHQLMALFSGSLWVRIFFVKDQRGLIIPRACFRRGEGLIVGSLSDVILDTKKREIDMTIVWKLWTLFINGRRFNILLYAYKLALIPSLSCKKFKIIFTLKRGHKGEFICIQKNIKSATIFE